MTSRAHLEFAFTLDEALSPDRTRAVCWSPYSVASALTLVARGAEGTTRDELVALLLGDKAARLDDLSELLAAAERLAEPRGDQDEPVIAVANTLWADERITLRDAFRVELDRMPSGAVRPAPFREDPDGARELINSDVAATTRDLIPELLPPGVIRPDTVAAIVNALYLKVAWVHPFEADRTEPRPFHTPAGVVDVPTMAQEETLGYARVAGWQAVAMPAVGGVQAVVLLPDEDLSVLDAESVENTLAALVSRKVSLRLPKLKLSTQAELAPVLNQLGVRTVFTDDADLSGISSDPLAVQAVLHEAVLKVDEKGLEGAAATAVMMRLMSFDTEQPVEVVVDRPFLLLVRHFDTGAVYFMARVTEPA